MNKTGFTIIELLITIVVIAILATISAVSYNNIQSRAKDTRRAQDIANIKKALLAYDAVHGGVLRTTTTPRYNPATAIASSGGWDKSTDAEWLAFLRADHGAMPVDSINTMGAGGNNPSHTHLRHRVYFYYCYPQTNNVRLGYHTENSQLVYTDFRVTECL